MSKLNKVTIYLTDEDVESIHKSLKVHNKKLGYESTMPSYIRLTALEFIKNLLK